MQIVRSNKGVMNKALQILSEHEEVGMCQLSKALYGKDTRKNRQKVVRLVTIIRFRKKAKIAYDRKEKKYIYEFGGTSPKASTMFC